MEVGGQYHALATLPLGKRPGTHWTGGWVGLRAGLDSCGKSRPPLGFDSLTVHPVVSRYTDYVILAHFGALTALLMKIIVFWDITVLL
jgi:hypothetical protein